MIGETKASHSTTHHTNGQNAAKSGGRNGIRQRPILPSRLQLSTFGAERLNFCVRDENRWFPFAIVTGMVEGFKAPSQLLSE